MSKYKTPHDHPDRRQIRHEQDHETGLYSVHVDGARTHEKLTLGEATLAVLDHYRKYGADLRVSLPTAGPLVKRKHKLAWPSSGHVSLT